MKKIITCLLASICILAVGVTCFADGGKAPWYPEDINAFQDFHNADAKKIVDDADVFTDSQEEELLEKIEGLIDETGFDFVIYTTPTSYNYGSNHGLLAADFYQFNGYGYDEYYSGSVLMICFEEGNRGWYSAACGYAEEYFTRETVNELDDSIDSDMRSGNYYGAMRNYIDKLEDLYLSGVPEYSSGYEDEYYDEDMSGYGGSYAGAYKKDNTLIHVGIAAIAGIITGLIVVLALTSGMKKVRIATNANLYVVPGSSNLRVKRDRFLYAQTRRVLREDNNNRRGGGSSFSGGFSSSGGRSFSGGGRSF